MIENKKVVCEALLHLYTVLVDDMLSLASAFMYFFSLYIIALRISIQSDMQYIYTVSVVAQSKGV